MNYKKLIRAVPDFPRPGILFQDITPILKTKGAFNALVDDLTRLTVELKPDVIVCIESRGFIIGAPVAYKLNLPFIPIRKKNKLPRDVIEQEFKLEYGVDTIAVHAHDFNKGERVVVIDDVIATSGTMKAAIKILDKVNVNIAGIVAIGIIKALCPPDIFEKYQIKYLLDF